MSRYSRITGTGSYLPPRRLTNDDLAQELAAKGVETSDEWIVARTGIRARHFAAPEVCSSDLALEACKSALTAAGVAASDIDLIVEFNRLTGYFALFSLQDHLEQLLGMHVDLGTRESLKPRVREAVLLECINVA